MSVASVAVAISSSHDLSSGEFTPPSAVYFLGPYNLSSQLARSGSGTQPRLGTCSTRSITVAGRVPSGEKAIPPPNVRVGPPGYHAAGRTTAAHPSTAAAAA